MANRSALAPDADLSLTITRTFDAPREAVFNAWIDPRQIANWLGPRGVRMECTEMQPWPGGSYRMVARDDAGNGNIVVGVFKQVDSPARLAFTWAWENRADRSGDTLVTVTFVAVGTHTEMTLHHERFPTEDTAVATRMAGTPRSTTWPRYWPDMWWCVAAGRSALRLARISSPVA